eukprot:GGOE01010725.1.p1 GENE.GGOE01010725.1~~GGOE01010725.1.p1  ORF type:complete len:862 (+),score=197.86 GGOE01010725.1:35-2587(+)
MWSAFNAKLPETWVLSAVCGKPQLGSSKAKGNSSLYDSCTVCLRPTTTSVQNSDVDALRSIIQLLESNSVCVLVQEEEYGTTALYVHSSRPLKHMLDLGTLSKLDIQPQRAWTFQISPPCDADLVQELISHYCTLQVGLNAGCINRSSNQLTVFEDKDAARPPLLDLDTFNVHLSFQKDVCPFGDMPSSDQEEATICIKGNASGVAELEYIKEALIGHHEPAIKAMWIDFESLGLHVLPSSRENILPVRAFVLNVLESMGLQASTRWNSLPLREEEHSISPFSSEIKVGVDQRGKDRGSIIQKYNCHDLITKLLWRLGYNGQVKRRPNHIAISLSGCKCLKCGQSIVEALLQQNGKQVEVASIFLNLSRNVLMVTAVNEEESLCAEHVQSILSELGIKSSVVLSDPLDLDGSESQQGELEIENYVRSMKPSNKAIAPSTGATEVIEVGLLPEALRCGSCSDLLQFTLRIIMPGLRNLAINVKNFELMVEYEVEQVTEAEIIAQLVDLGYQPKVISRGRHLQPKLYDDLLGPCEDQLPVKHLSLPDASCFFGGHEGECIAMCPAKLIIRSQISDTVKEELLVVYSFAQEVVPLNTTFQKGASETLRLFVQDSITGIILPIEDPTLADAELEFPYTMWYEKVMDRSRGEQTRTQLQTFRTLQQFWKVWTSIDLYKLNDKDVLMLFRESIPPELSHPANCNGGRWYTRALPEETRKKLWIGVVLAVIGQTLQDNTCNEVCGVVLSVKPGGDRFEVWVDGGYHHQLKYGHERAPLHRQLSSTMGEILARVLKLAAGPQRLHYWTHEAYERHRRLHSGSARRDKRKQYAKQLLSVEASSSKSLPQVPSWEGDDGD